MENLLKSFQPDGHAHCVVLKRRTDPRRSIFQFRLYLATGDRENIEIHSHITFDVAAENLREHVLKMCCIIMAREDLQDYVGRTSLAEFYPHMQLIWKREHTSIGEAFQFYARHHEQLDWHPWRFNFYLHTPWSTIATSETTVSQRSKTKISEPSQAVQVEQAVHDEMQLELPLIESPDFSETPYVAPKRDMTRIDPGIRFSPQFDSSPLSPQDEGEIRTPTHLATMEIVPTSDPSERNWIPISVLDTPTRDVPRPATPISPKLGLESPQLDDEEMQSRESSPEVELSSRRQRASRESSPELPRKTAKSSIKASPVKSSPEKSSPIKKSPSKPSPVKKIPQKSFPSSPIEKSPGKPILHFVSPNVREPVTPEEFFATFPFQNPSPQEWSQENWKLVPRETSVQAMPENQSQDEVNVAEIASHVRKTSEDLENGRLERIQEVSRIRSPPRIRENRIEQVTIVTQKSTNIKSTELPNVEDWDSDDVENDVQEFENVDMEVELVSQRRETWFWRLVSRFF